MEARSFAFDIVGLVCVFVTLWVGIGSGIHKNYEVPTPVGYLGCYPFISTPHRG